MTLPLAATTNSPVPVIEPIKIIGLALQNELGLPAGQIMLGLENWAIPANTGLYIAITYGPDTVLGNNQYNDTNAQDEFNEVKETSMLHQIDIDIMSFDSSARTQKQRVLQALTSQYTQNLMGSYQMRIASTPGAFTPVLDPEPAKQLNRFRITIAVNALYRTTDTVDYYDSLGTVELTENA